MSQGDAVTSSIHSILVSNQLNSVCGKNAWTEKKKGSFNISCFKNNPNKDLYAFFFRKNSIFPSLIRAELNYLGSIGQVMLLCPRCPHILFFFLFCEKHSATHVNSLLLSHWPLFLFLFVFCLFFRTISFLTSSAS